MNPIKAIYKAIKRLLNMSCKCQCCSGSQCECKPDIKELTN